MKLTKKTNRKLVESIGGILVKLVNDEFSTKQLDNILSVLLETLTSFDNIDKNIIKEMINLENKHKERLSKRNLEKLINLRKKNKENETIIDEETTRRLYKHFEQESLNESKVQKKKDNTFEVKTKYLIPHTKLYFEQQKVLLTMLTSNICEQEDIDKIKKLIENGNDFTKSIKSVIKRKENYTRIKRLCELQDERFKHDEEKSKRLY